MTGVAGFETVYLARHGQTQWNTQGRRQGQLDSPLTALGLEQVRRNAESLSAEAIDAVFSSPLGRARESALVLAASRGLPVVVLEELGEVDHGEFAGLTRAEIEAAYPGQLDARQRDKYGYRFPGGESYADADVRAQRALHSVARTGARRPLLVSHEMLGRMLLKNLAGLSSEDALQLGQPWDVVYRLVPGQARIERL